MKARTVNVHASCVCLGSAGSTFGVDEDAGVLLFGKTGAGKSDLTLRLVATGARLVADDRTELFLRGGCLYAKPPRSLAGLIEVRGVGIVSVPYVDETKVVLALELVRRPKRLPDPANYVPPRALKAPLTIKIPLLRLAALEASAPAKVAVAAVAALRNCLPATVKND